MRKKYPKSDADYLANLVKGEPAYFTWDDSSFTSAFQGYAKTLEEFKSVQSSRASYRQTFDNLTERVSSRPGLTPADYEWYREAERIPPLSDMPMVLTACNEAYLRVGLIRNVIDLMGDFACQGIRLVHPNKRIENFYDNWWKQVKGQERSERFLNLLFRVANVVIRSKVARVSKSKRDNMMRSMAAADMDIRTDDKRYLKSEIPWQYVFIDPRSVRIAGGALASFVGQKQYILQIPRRLTSLLTGARTAEEYQRLLSLLPDEIRRAVEQPGQEVLLPSDRTFVYHYKKDDWLEWAVPMVYACLDDIITLSKLKLADRAALDGAISKIRVWKLGNLDHKLAPTPAAAAALADILENHVGGGTSDIVWGPDIELIESDTNVHQFLGREKYEPTLTTIYQTLGIPPTLTGTFGASGTTNNLISLKTLTERLKYARETLLSFLNEQIQIVQRSMGFRYPAEVEFDFMNLEDAAAVNQLLINLADRGVVSDEFVQRHVGASPRLETRRLKKESKERESGTMSPKASPYHDPDKQHNLEKVFAQTGAVTPSEVGLELKPKKKGQKTALEQRAVKPMGTNTTSPNNQVKKKSTPGRPKNSPDTTPRKQKTFKPKTRAVIEIWAREAQDRISDLLNPGFLFSFSKKNMRSLSAKEFEQAERLKFEVLCNLEPLEPINNESINRALSLGGIDQTYHNLCESWIAETKDLLSRPLTIEEVRNIKANFYIQYKEDTFPLN